MRSILTILSLIIMQSGWAQWRTIDITPSSVKGTQAEKILTLPFFEDFSTSGETPDTSRWQGSQNVFVNDALSKNPPSYKAATFDGLNQNGRAYRISGTSTAPTDSLMSHTIDLSTVSPSDSVYFSFFWQAGGYGESPEERDSLVLQFFADTAWVSQWKMIGDPDTIITDFQQVLIPIKNQRYFNNKFKFKFVAYGRPSGPFDVWHVDYIFLNKNRSQSDSVYADRTLVNKPTSLFAPFASIPAEVFYSDPSKFTSQFRTIGINLNLNGNNQTVSSFYTIEDITDTKVVLSSGSLINERDPDSKEFIPGVENPLISPETFNFTVPFTPLDSQILQLTLSIDPKDQLLEDTEGNITNIDHKINDTIRQQYLLQDHYAYDDGSAEFAVGINKKYGKIAMQYVIPVSDTLTHIDIHFPHIAPSSDSSIINIMVWDRLNEEKIFLSQRYTIQPSTERNQFQRIALNRQKVVKDTIYIGFQQNEAVFIPVGFDRNNPEAKSNVFYRTGEFWSQNENLDGALMIRPVFAKAGEIILSNAHVEQSFTLYPNPAPNGRFRISGSYERLSVYSLSGSLVYESETKAIHELPSHQKGLFIVKISNGGEHFTFKLIVE